MTIIATSSTPALVSIFDGRCVICQATRRIAMRLDWRRRIEFLDLHQHEAVAARYPQLDAARMMGEVHVLDRAGTLYAGYFGTKRMLRELPLLWPLWALLLVPGMDWVGQRVYAWVAKHRYAVNRWLGVDLGACEDGACQVPQGK